MKTLNVIIALALTQFASQLRAENKKQPSLIVLIVVDQGRYDYFNRFRGDFQGGFAKLRNDSLWFKEAHHRHAPTITAAGHATISTGTYPRKSGITANYYPDPILRRQRSAFSAPDGTASPASMLTSALPDWLKEQQPTAKIFSFSGKDRGAIPLAGKHGKAYWYDRLGGFQTSPFYGEPPSWVVAFNSSLPADKYFGKPWEGLPLLQGTLLDRGVVSGGFPHEIGTLSGVKDRNFYSAVSDTPIVDALTAELARVALTEEKLGTGSSTDYLGLSFSAVDTIGHRYGPHSEEIYDAMRRLDLMLGDLFSAIEAQVGLNKTLIALTADHGAIPYPEVESHPGAARIGNADIECHQSIPQILDKRFGSAGVSKSWFISEGYLDHGVLAAKKLRASEVRKVAAAAFSKCPHTAAVWTLDDLVAAPEETTDPYLAAYRRSYFPGRTPDLIILPEKYFLPLSKGGTHFTPYEYDTHVPFALYGFGVAPKEIGGPVSTVDIAPTVAAISGIPIPSNIDGVARPSPTEQRPKRAT